MLCVALATSDDTGWMTDQKVQWNGVMRGIAASSFSGIVAHEFLPIAPNPLTSPLKVLHVCEV